MFNDFINKVNRRYRIFLGHFFPKKLANILYVERTKKREGISWCAPKDLNEKINWLKFYSDTAMWTTLADKYNVREFICQKGFEDILVKLYGVWESPDEIDFDNLPNKFVIKTNNGAGTVWVVRDKKSTNILQLKENLRSALKIKFGVESAEPHYLKIKPLIIAEELLEENNSFSTSLVDYKVWCFDGKVFATWCCYNRKGFEADTEWHDLDWKFRPEWSIFTDHYKNGHGRVPCPSSYTRMMEIASTLSKGFPQVRIDFYNVRGRIYFGEMTFTCAGGYMNFYSQEVLDIMGDMIQLD